MQARKHCVGWAAWSRVEQHGSVGSCQAEVAKDRTSKLYLALTVGHQLGLSSPMLLIPPEGLQAPP